MSAHLTTALLRDAGALVRETESAGGLAPVDLERFWADQEKAVSDPWAGDCPQLPLGIAMSNECVFIELAEPEDWYRLIHDDPYRVGLEKRYNDAAERIVGRRLLGERSVPAERRWPEVKPLNDIFEAKNEWSSWSYWIHQSARNPDELEALLDRVELRLENLRDFILPPGWEKAKRRLTSMGETVPLYRGQRGPITFAMSVYGVENLIYLIIDRPDLAARFSRVILDAILERARILDEEAGYTPSDAPRGWGWADDNCAMLNAEMYEFFGYPILERVFDRYAPDPGDRRGQHSDSDMAHLLPFLGRLGLSWANFGPTLTVAEIREHLPKAVIHGQLAPFTFSRDEKVNMVAETIRDFEMSAEKRGVVFTTAGSINNGSRLSGMRLIMYAIQKRCRY